MRLRRRGKEAGDSGARTGLRSQSLAFPHIGYVEYIKKKKIFVCLSFLIYKAEMIAPTPSGCCKD